MVQFLKKLAKQLLKADVVVIFPLINAFIDFNCLFAAFTIVPKTRD